MPVALAPGMGLNAYFAYQVPPPEFLLLLSYISQLCFMACAAIAMQCL